MSSLSDEALTRTSGDASQKHNSGGTLQNTVAPQSAWAKDTDDAICGGEDSEEEGEIYDDCQTTLPNSSKATSRPAHADSTQNIRTTIAKPYTQHIINSLPSAEHVGLNYDDSGVELEENEEYHHLASDSDQEAISYNDHTEEIKTRRAERLLQFAQTHVKRRGWNRGTPTTLKKSNTREGRVAWFIQRCPPHSPELKRAIFQAFREGYNHDEGYVEVSTDARGQVRWTAIMVKARLGVLAMPWPWGVNYCPIYTYEGKGLRHKEQAFRDTHVSIHDNRRGEDQPPLQNKRPAVVTEDMVGEYISDVATVNFSEQISVHYGAEEVIFVGLLTADSIQYLSRLRGNPTCAPQDPSMTDHRLSMTASSGEVESDERTIQNKHIPRASAGKKSELTEGLRQTTFASTSRARSLPKVDNDKAISTRQGLPQLSDRSESHSNRKRDYHGKQHELKNTRHITTSEHGGLPKTSISQFLLYEDQQSTSPHRSTKRSWPNANPGKAAPGAPQEADMEPRTKRQKRGLGSSPLSNIEKWNDRVTAASEEQLQ